ncbi:flavin reductase family protein [Pseudonocardia sp. CA-107938]|uniref:flavin reductase family protein n=1 Tax=Pseudonocardia sp. CA-107938 TaxID=3240021 RepID=UPI003D8C5AB2
MSAPVLSPLQSRFREVMGSVCTPVSVVTTLDDGTPFGTTVSAFTSLSMEPPMVLVALDNGSALLAAVRRSRRFGVNVLLSEQAPLALRFAGKGGPAKFTDVSWAAEQHVPRLSGAGGFLACELAGQVPGGDHTVLLGTVLDADPTSGAPLTYHLRSFGTHSAHAQR